MIRIIKGGLLTTAQDLGRFGYSDIGMSPAGAADRLLLRAANLIVGNRENAAALECTMAGPLIEITEPTIISVACIDTNISVETFRAIELKPGERIDVGVISRGSRAYIAVRGGIRVENVMGSASTFLPAKIGGLGGRALRASDTLEIGNEIAGPTRMLDRAKILNHYASRPLRVTASSQFEWFDSRSFYQGEFEVSAQSNRSGLRLTGSKIIRKVDRELLTEGVSLGAVQVPQDGEPIILFVDQQTTGGYPKIANVIAADLPRVGQLRPLEEVRFQQVSLEDAINALRQQESEFYEAFSEC